MLPVQRAQRSSAGCFFIRLKVKATSAAVIGLPSLHFTLSRIVNTTDFLSAPQVYDEASIGVSAAFLSVFTNTSGSYTVPSDWALFAGLKGLNWQLQVWPATFAIVTTSVAWPVLPPSLLPLEQAAVSRLTATASAMTFLCLIVKTPHCLCCRR